MTLRLVSHGGCSVGVVKVSRHTCLGCSMLGPAVPLNLPEWVSQSSILPFLYDVVIFVMFYVCCITLTCLRIKDVQHYLIDYFS